MTNALLELKGVGRTFEHGATEAVRGVDLVVYRGEFVAIVGPSGAGKSSLLNILGLLDAPTSGSYFINGVGTSGISDVELDRLRASTFGFVFQDSFVLPSESVARNVALPLRMRGTAQSEQLAAVEDALELFGLIDTASQQAGTLSGGQRQRVAFARAVAGNQPVLLADEPTGNLDSGNTARVLEYLRSLHRQGTTIIVITHSDEVANTASRRIRIADGAIVEDRRTPEFDADAPGHDAQMTSKLPLTMPHRDGRRGRWHPAEALTALLLAPLRSLTILAAFIVAVAGLVSAANLTAAAAQQVSSTLSAAALDEVVVRLTNPEKLTEASQAARTLDGVTNVAIDIGIEASEARLNRVVGSSTLEVDAGVRVVDREFFALNGARVWPAHAVDLLDSADGSPVAILGPEAAATLGLDTDRVGERIQVSGQDVVVAGYVTGSERDATLANSVLVSKADYVLPQSGTWSLTVRTSPGLPAKIAEALPLTIDPAHPEHIKVQTVADIRDLTQGVNADLAVNAFLISAVMLALVCLTSSISMFLTVLARTREIALRRAVGASRRDIRTLFVAEGTLLGLAGGLAGCSVGVAVTTITCAALGWTPGFDPLGAVVAIGASLVAGAVSALVPARRASLVQPALALRSP